MVNRFAVNNFRKGVRVLPSASGTRIRIAQQEDSVAIAAVHAASWRGSYRGILSDEYLNEKLESERLSIWKRRLGFPKTNQYVTVAEQESQIVGFACAFGAEDELLGTMLDNLHVSTSQKGKGIGRKLVRDIAFWCDRSYPSKGLDFRLGLGLHARNIHENDAFRGGCAFRHLKCRRDRAIDKQSFPAAQRSFRVVSDFARQSGIAKNARTSTGARQAMTALRPHSSALFMSAASRI